MNYVESSPSDQGTKDRLAGQLGVDYYSAGSASGYKLAPGRFCSTVVKCTGANPSYALAGVPMREIMGAGAWDQYPGVALRNDSYAGQVKLLSRASVYYREGTQKQTLMNGWVVYHGHTVAPGEDSVMTAIFDDRHIMGAYFTLFGKMYYDPSTGRHYFVDDPEDPLIFNKGGWGDCIDTPFGPRFAPGRRYGYTSTDEADPADEPAAGYASTKTRKWTVRDINRYIREFVYEVSKRPPLGQDLGLLELPRAFIKWAESFGSNITENKTPRDWNLEGTNLLEGITRTLAYAGPYELLLEPINEQQSEMKVVKFDLKKNQGANIYHPNYFNNDLNAAIWNSSIAQRVNIKESAAGWIDNVVNMGGAPSVDLTVSTDGTDSEAWAGYLVPGWTQAEEDAFKALVSNAALGGEKDTQNAFTLACRKYPSVYCWYRIANSKNPFTGTKWAMMGQSGNWRIKPHLNTSYNSNAQSPLGLVPMECIVEYKLYTEGAFVESPTSDPDMMGRWRWADRYNELQLSPDSRYVQLPAMRDRAKNWYTYHDNGGGGNDAGQYQGVYMKKRDIRITLAVASDHALAAKRGGDPNGTKGRIDPGVPPFTLLMRNQPMQYADLLRNVQAYPVGIGGIPAALRTQLTARFQAKRSAGNEIFTDHIGDGNIANPKNRLLSHADKYLSNYKRISYEGDFTIARLAPCWQPGMQVSYTGHNVISNVFGMIKCVIFDANSQTTRIEFGPPAYSTIWDGPLTLAAGTGSGGGTPYVPSESGKSGGDSYGGGSKTKPSDYPTGSPSKPDAPYPTSSSGGRVSSPSDNDSEANNQAIRNNSSAAGAGARGDSGGAGDAGVSGQPSSDPSVVRPGESMEAYGQRMKRQNLTGALMNGNESLAPKESAKRTSSSRDFSQKNRDYNIGEGNESFDKNRFDPKTGREKAAGKGIYFGDSLKGLDEDRKQRTFEPGGIRDQFREGAGQKVTTGAPAQSASQDVRLKAAYQADVARGFNPNGAAMPGQSSRAAAAAKPMKAYESSSSWNAKQDALVNARRENAASQMNIRSIYGM